MLGGSLMMHHRLGALWPKRLRRGAREHHPPEVNGGCGQTVVRSSQVVARAFAFIWSNSAWVIVPASRSSLADAI
jgi:hypothetical protein